MNASLDTRQLADQFQDIRARGGDLVVDVEHNPVELMLDHRRLARYRGRLEHFGF